MMRLALVMLFTNELPYLQLHLPVFYRKFDGLVAITDPGTTDGSIEFMRSLGAHILVESWTYNWGNFATRVFNEAERLGFEGAFRIDGDEAVMPDAPELIRHLLETEATLLCFPRHEFFGSRSRVRGDLYPDFQARAWRLRRGVTVQGKRHEGVSFQQHGLSEHSQDPDTRVLRVKEPHIYHYGWIGKTGIWRNQVKYQRHAQVEAGGPEHVAFPPDTPLVSFPTIPFTGEQPLNPETVGLFAPFKD